MEEKLRRVNISELEDRVEVLELTVVKLEDDVEDLEDSQILDAERFLAVEEDIESVENAVFGKTFMQKCNMYSPKIFYDLGTF